MNNETITALKKENSRIKQQNIMAWVMFLNGILLAWGATWLIPPIGEISGSVLGYIGTCFSVGGMMWGFGIWVTENFQRKTPQQQ